MKRSLTLGLIALAVAALSAHADAPKHTTAADKVKATATATRPDADGKQIVTITLEIEKGCHVYANPVNHNNEFLDANRTWVKITAKEKLALDVKYPAGRTLRDSGEVYDIYEGVIKIQATVARAKGDASPLEIVIRAHGWISLGY